MTEKSSGDPGFLEELKRRHVVRAGAVYAAVGFVVIEVAQALIPALLLPEWLGRAVVLLVILGFPIALVIAWAFELTPDGVRREATGEPEATATGPGSSSPGVDRSWLPLSAVVLVALMVAIGFGVRWLAPGGQAEARKDAAPFTEGVAEEAVAEPEPSAGRPTGADARASLDRRTVAILPFADLGGEEEARSFAAGLHSDLLTRLSRSPSLTVISRTSVLPYGETEATLPEIARTLGAGTIIEGDVQQAGGRVRLNIQLIDARTDSHRWAETFDRQLSADGLFEIQSELAERIAATLETELRPGGSEAEPDHAPTGDLEAFRLHAQGRTLLDRRTEDPMREALSRFRAALERDPDYALAWVGVSASLSMLHAYGYESDEVLAEATAAAQRALELEPELAEAFVSLGGIAYTRRDGPEAIRLLERALELQPNHADAYSILAYVSALLGRASETLAHARRAVQLDPLSPEPASNFALGHLLTGSLDRAVEEARSVKELAPAYSTGPFYEALVLYEMGRFEEAARLVDGLRVAWAHPGPQATLALARAALGDRESARRRLARFEEEDQQFAAGLLHLALGDPDRAFGAFDRVDRWADWPSMAVNSLYRDLWASVRGDARYEALRARVLTSWGFEVDG